MALKQLQSNLSTDLVQPWGHMSCFSAAEDRSCLAIALESDVALCYERNMEYLYKSKPSLAKDAKILTTLRSKVARNDVIFCLDSHGGLSTFCPFTLIQLDLWTEVSKLQFRIYKMGKVFFKWDHSITLFLRRFFRFFRLDFTSIRYKLSR